MKLVILMGDSPVSAFLVQEIGRQCHIAAVVRPARVHRKPKKQGLLASARLPKTIASAARGRFYGWRHKRMSRQISLQLFGSPNWPIPAAAREIPDRDINHAASVRFFESLQPDVLLVCGAPILKPQIFSIPRIGTYNLHFGIAPEYRGQNTLFWALYRRDYDKIGFTLHGIDEGVDTGDIWARGYPALHPHDTEVTLWVKSARMAARLITEFLPEAERQQPSGMPQGSGQNFPERDRTVWRDLKFLWNQSVLNRRLPARPGKVERFFSGVPSNTALSVA